MELKILHRDEIRLGGFAGLTEHQLVMDPKAFGSHANPAAWKGLGNMVYLADARFNPLGETRMHSHREVDVISVMVEGRISHRGSMKNGQELKSHDVQVQRAGGEGFSHNEVNPDSAPNRMIQLWVLPEISGQPSGYGVYSPKWGHTTRIYGGPAMTAESPGVFPANTIIEVALLKAGQRLERKGESLSYLVKGKANAGDATLTEGDLFRGLDLGMTADEDSQVIVVSLAA